jgi:quinol monooxygenase YgiN
VIESEFDMIIVLGSIVARPDSFDALLGASLEHVHRSRGEPGCVSHTVQVDAENPLKLQFVEKWSDGAALAAHFKVPESMQFVGTARKLGAEAPVIEVFAATLQKL